jgi:hypothetical protein
MDIRATLERLIRHITRDSIYLKTYGVVVQRGHDNTVDVIADAAELQGMELRQVPVMTSPAGTSARVEPGTRGLLAFADGDPRKPRIVAWEYSKGSAVVSLAGGNAGVARNGDLVELQLSPMAPVSGVISGTVETPNPSPPPATITVPVPPGTQFTGFVQIAPPIRGRIFGGARRVKA